MGEQLRSAAWYVHGRVQGVGFRYFVARTALSLGLTGWTRNLMDGTVEVQARGALPAVAALETALRAGPGHARVDRLESFSPSKSLEKAGSFIIEY